VRAMVLQAVDLEGMDMELDLSNLGTINTVFAALFRCVTKVLQKLAITPYHVQKQQFCLH
jgi:hypothetical protein